MNFSEASQIALSVIVIAIAFSLSAFFEASETPATTEAGTAAGEEAAGQGAGAGWEAGLEAFAIAAILAVFTVGVGFVFHELAHKYVAQNFGAFAQFRAWNFGLGLALAMSIATKGTFVFAAPGAVVIYGKRISKKQNGLISLAGPLANFAIATAFASMALAFPAISEPALFGARVNAFLGLFNLIPIFPLDGEKALKWSASAWALCTGLLLVMLTYLIIAFPK